MKASPMPELIRSICPRCQTPVAGTPDPVAGTLRCEGCDERFDPRQHATRPSTPAPLPEERAAWQPAAGMRIGGCVLESELGRGGMSAVWAARQESLNRPVAIKLLHAHLAADTELRRRFLREAEALIQVDHERIVPVFDQGEHDGRPYLITALAGRASLRDELGDGEQHQRLDAARVRQIARQGLEGLARAHGRGLVHRDIKPENLIVDEHGAVRIADFGIAQISRGLDGRTLTQLTRTDIVMGTVAYMAPEQSTGSRAVDRRCDLYALGVICYEALCGHRPVGRFEDPGDALAGVGERERKAWNRFVLALLERDPDKRPADARAALRLLDRVDRAAEGRERDVAAMAGEASAVDAVRTSEDFPHGRRLLRDREYGWLGGVFAGLGAWSGVHPNWWRLGFLLLTPLSWMTLLGYVAAVIFVPPCNGRYRPRPLNHTLPRRGQGWLLGVCELLAERTVMPTGVWRLLFVLGLPLMSWAPYLLLGILLPPPATQPSPLAPAATETHDDAVEATARRRSGAGFWGMVALCTGLAAWYGFVRFDYHDGMATLLAWCAGIATLSALFSGVRRDGRPWSGAPGGMVVGAGAVLLAGMALEPLGQTSWSLAGLPLSSVAIIVAMSGVLLGLSVRRYAVSGTAIAALLGLGACAWLLPQWAQGGSFWQLGYDLPAYDPGRAVALGILVWSVAAALLHVISLPIMRADRVDAARFNLAGSILGLGVLGALATVFVASLSSGISVSEFAAPVARGSGFGLPLILVLGIGLLVIAISSLGRRRRGDQRRGGSPVVVLVLGGVLLGAFALFGTAIYSSSSKPGSQRPRPASGTAFDPRYWVAERGLTPVAATDGTVVIEAEHAVGFDAADTGWRIEGDDDAFGSAFAIYAGHNYFDDQHYKATMDELRYPIFIEQPGNYRVWLRSMCEDGSQNSVYLGLDGTGYGVFSAPFASDDTWRWSNGDDSHPQQRDWLLRVDQPGVHVLQVWSREAKTRIDRIMLTADLALDPSDAELVARPPSGTEPPADGAAHAEELVRP